MTSSFKNPGREHWEQEQFHQQERCKVYVGLLSAALSVPDADYRRILSAYDNLGPVIEKIKRAGEKIEELSPKRVRIQAPARITEEVRMPKLPCDQLPDLEPEFKRIGESIDRVIAMGSGR